MSIRSIIFVGAKQIKYYRFVSIIGLLLFTFCQFAYFIHVTSDYKYNYNNNNNNYIHSCNSSVFAFCSNSNSTTESKSSKLSEEKSSFGDYGLPTTTTINANANANAKINAKINIKTAIIVAAPATIAPATIVAAAADDDDDDNFVKIKITNLHVVISHCKLSIGWIWEHYLHNQISYKSITIITKCGVPIPTEDMPPITFTITTTQDQDQDQDQDQNQDQDQVDQDQDQDQKTNNTLVQIISLPNVGRCDHSYAYWIAMVLGNGNVNVNVNEDNKYDDDSYYQLLYSNQKNKDEYNNNNINNNNNNNNININNNPFQLITNSIDPKDYVLFMKDNNNEYRKKKMMDNPVTVQDLFFETQNSYSGMACGEQFNPKDKYYNSWTNWAHRGIMWNLVQFKIYSADKYSSNNNNNNNNKVKVVNFKSIHRPMGGMYVNC
jgi:hypothetical protein